MDETKNSTDVAKISVILRDRNDWRLWYEGIWTTAILEGIWDDINPDITPKPPARVEPEEPTGDSNSAWKRYPIQINKWLHFKAGRAKLYSTIISSLSPEVRDRTSLKLKTADLYDIFKHLKGTIALTDEEEKINATIRYSKARATPLSQKDVSTWINEFEVAAGQYKDLVNNKYDE
ncbi:hypothetical protein BJX63DRAFT_437182 [Aspergillus granulosus]|uniref:Uncharacterized protein n=1 Tax=Aspergillus granulosus TaxID=176169 RepID=A0ABR4GVS0_9EURO